MLGAKTAGFPMLPMGANTAGKKKVGQLPTAAVTAFINQAEDLWRANRRPFPRWAAEDNCMIEKD